VIRYIIDQNKVTSRTDKILGTFAVEFGTIKSSNVHISNNVTYALSCDIANRYGTSHFLVTFVTLCSTSRDLMHDVLHTVDIEVTFYT
jgi:hypothetical protein